MCHEVPVNVRQSKGLLLDTSRLADPADCTCDEMPWVKQKGRISKQYIIQEKNGKPYRIWPKGNNEQPLPDSCQVLKAYKSIWVHSRTKDVHKTMIGIEGNPIVIIVYAGLNYQPELKMGKRRVRPSTMKLVDSALLHSKSMKQIVSDVTEKVSNDGYTAPSILPTYRSVKWVKEKKKKEEIKKEEKEKEKKKEEKKRTFVELCHKMAEEDDTFIRCQEVSGNVVSVVLYNNQQLSDLRKFCTNPEYPCSALGIDTTFQFGNFYVVTTSYRHLFLQNKEGKFPIMLGPILVTHRLQRVYYRVLFDHITRDAPELASELKAFVTDGELALQQAASEAFRCALSLMSLPHMERTIKCKVRNELKLSGHFYNTVIKDLSGDEFCKGLVHSQSYEEYTTNLSKLKTKWDNLEQEECAHREPQFWTYFQDCNAKQVYDHCLVKSSNKLHLVPEIPDNNPPEAMHAVMRRWQEGMKKDILAFIEDMRDLVTSQQIDVKRAFLGNAGPYSLRYEYAHHRLDKESLYGEGSSQKIDFNTVYETVQVQPRPVASESLMRMSSTPAALDLLGLPPVALGSPPVH